MRFIFLLLLSLLITCSVRGQDYREYAVSVFSQATAFPSLRFVKAPIHPGLRLAVNWSKGREAGRQHYGFRELAVAGFSHPQFQRALYATYHLGYHRDLGLGIFAEGMAGLGYMHSFSGKAIFEPGDDGSWTQVRDWGRPNALFSMQLGLGYDIPNFPLKPFIRYQFMLQGPWAPDNGFPAQPHTAFHIGSSFSF